MEGDRAMTIAAILAGKEARLVSAEAALTVREAAALLAEHRIGSLPVMKGGKVAGIISERDIVYCLAREGEAVLDRTVGDVMTSPAITVAPDMPALTALSMMSSKRIRHLPVVEGGELIGIVSIGDLVAFRIARIEQDAEAMLAYIQSS
jgi:CBS domain-containing protein